MKFLAALLIVLAVSPCFAGEIEYRPGGKALNATWQAFYVDGDHEPDIDDPLIARGRSMVPAICNAIKHKDMKRRRYAIGALGFIGDRHALPTLEDVLNDRSEIDYFREDALHSIYQLDRKLGHTYAKRYKKDPGMEIMTNAVLRNEPWLLDASEE